MKTDHDLLQEYRTYHSEDAFTEIVRRHSPMVLRTSFRTVKNRDDAEDVVQSVFQVLVERTREIPCSLSSYLHQIARQTAGMLVRSGAKRVKREKVVAKMEATGDWKELDGVKEELDEAIGSLPTLIHEAMILRHLEGWSVEESAQIAGCGTATIERRCQKGLEQLRQILSYRTGKAVSASALLILLAHEAAMDEATMPLKKLQLSTLLNLEPTTRAVQLTKAMLKTLFWSKVKIAATSVVGILLAITAVALPLQTYLAKAPPEVARPTELKAAPRRPATRPPTSVVLRGHNAGIQTLAFSNDGKSLASAGNDGKIILWNLASKQQRVRLQGQHKTSIIIVQFSPDGRSLVSQSEDGIVKLWNATTGKLLVSLTGQSVQKSWSITFTQDSAALMVIGGDGMTRQWNTVTGKEKPAFRATPSSALTTDVSPDGSTAATGSADGNVTVSDQATGQALFHFQAHKMPIDTIGYNPDGTQILTESADHTLRLWDAATGKLQFSYPRHANWVGSAFISPDGATIVESGEDNSVYVWDTRTGLLRHSFPLPKPASQFLAWTNDRNTLALVEPQTARTVMLWDVPTGKQKAILKGRAGNISTLNFTLDNRTLATGSEDGAVELWDLFPGQK